jgi:hypothetical protein
MRNLSWTDKTINRGVLIDEARNVTLYEYDASAVRVIPEGQASLSPRMRQILDKFDTYNT